MGEMDHGGETPCCLAQFVKALSVVYPDRESPTVNHHNYPFSVITRTRYIIRNTFGLSVLVSKYDEAFRISSYGVSATRTAVGGSALPARSRLLHQKISSAIDFVRVY